MGIWGTIRSMVHCGGSRSPTVRQLEDGWIWRELHSCPS